MQTSVTNMIMKLKYKLHIPKHKDSHKPTPYQFDGGKKNIIIYIAFVYLVKVNSRNNSTLIQCQISVSIKYLNTGKYDKNRENSQL